MRSILIFARAPVLGQVKTRVARRSTPEFALRLYRCLLERTLALVKNISVEVCFFVDGDASAFSEQLVFAQHGRDLGERMTRAFAHTFARGRKSCVLIGSDCPSLTPEIIESAFQALGKNDVVIGPARDGGYYLIGMNALHEELFQRISWSSSEVLKQTVERIRVEGLTFFLLPVFSDVDEWEDIPNEIFQELL